MKNTAEKIKKKINNEFKTGNVQHAIELCQIELQNDPTNADLHVRLGDLYLEWHLDIYNSCQYIDEAITEYQRALETYIDSAEIYFKIAQAFFFKGDLDKAINYLNAAISKDENMSKAYYLLAEIFTKKARFLEAVYNAKRAVKLSPLSNSCAHFLLHNLYKISSRRNFKRWLQSNFEYATGPEQTWNARPRDSKQTQGWNCPTRAGFCQSPLGTSLGGAIIRRRVPITRTRHTQSRGHEQTGHPPLLHQHTPSADD